MGCVAFKKGLRTTWGGAREVELEARMSLAKAWQSLVDGGGRNDWSKLWGSVTTRLETDLFLA